MTVETDFHADDEATGRSPSDECDLVMKGGITSGVAYPAAVGVLAEKYRFRGIGGASAGAIAAAITAAAEYARQHGSDGFARLAEVRQELKEEPGLLPRLFAPSRRARPLIELVLAMQARQSRAGKAWTFLRLGVGRLLPPAVAVVLTVAVVLALLVRSAGGTVAALDGIGWTVVTVVLLISAVLGLVLAALLRLVLLVRHLPTAQYGMVAGLAPDGSEPALTEWLDAKIQHVADKDPNEPLTFKDLAGDDETEPDVVLRMMTTDLTIARPVRFPVAKTAGYHYEPDAWAKLFPPHVMTYLDGLPDDVSPRVTVDSRQLRALPAEEVPVLVATRMSLSFPILLAAVPVWTKSASGAFVEHWISDGGISSNFPIHFFDAWVPRRPTFGLNLVPAPRASDGLDGGGTRPPVADVVKRYDNTRPPPVRRAEISGVVAFMRQILDTMQNWTDTMQSDLPGFRDRIVHIGLAKDEGGMNITMPPSTIQHVDDKGAEAGRQLCEFDFDTHWLARYAGAMREIQRNLRGDDEPPRIRGLREAFTDDRVRWLREDGATAATGLEIDTEWCEAAAAATSHLLDDVDGWLNGADMSFTTSGRYDPPGVLRITPDI